MGFDGGLGRFIMRVYNYCHVYTVKSRLKPELLYSQQTSEVFYLPVLPLRSSVAYKMKSVFPFLSGGLLPQILEEVDSYRVGCGLVY